MKPSHNINSCMQLGKTDCPLNARLSDICIGTSAAPTYLPAYHFKNQINEGELREFNLVDGGVAANNPVYMYILTLLNYICLIKLKSFKRFN